MQKYMYLFYPTCLPSLSCKIVLLQDSSASILIIVNISVFFNLLRVSNSQQYRKYARKKHNKCIFHLVFYTFNTRFIFQRQNSITISHASLSLYHNTMQPTHKKRILYSSTHILLSRSVSTFAPSIWPHLLSGSGCVRDDLSDRRVGLVLFAFLALRRQAGGQNPVAWETHAGYTCRKGYERTWADRAIARSTTNRFRRGFLSSPAVNDAILYPLSLRCIDRSRCLAIEPISIVVPPRL